jgi:hypothetical protein
MNEPIKLPDFTALLKEAEAEVVAKPVYQRFIDGTPLSNDVPVWMAVFAEHHARLAVEQATAEMRRDIASSKNDVEQMQHEINMLASRAEKAEAINAEWAEKAKAWMASPESLQQLSGYRELGDKLAKAEAERDASRAELARRGCPDSSPGA